MSKLYRRVPGRLAAVVGRLVIVIGVATMLAGSPGVVGATSAPRLAGHFQVTLTITKANYSLYHKGDKFTRDWGFAPTCTSGGCTTKLTVADSAGDVHFTLKPVLKHGAWTYTAKFTHPDNCYALDGTTVVKKNGYSSTEQLVLKVGQVSGGAVTTFTGTYKLTFTASTAAKALGCPAQGNAKGKFKN